jgi:hypothetical protein
MSISKKNKLNYYIEEYIFSFDSNHKYYFKNSISKFLADRVNKLYQSDLKFGKHNIFKVKADKDFFIKWINMDCEAFMQDFTENTDFLFPGYYKYYYFIVIDKSYKRDIDKNKLLLYKTINNKNLLDDLLNIYSNRFNHSLNITEEKLIVHAIENCGNIFDEIFYKHSESIYFKPLLRDLL